MIQSVTNYVFGINKIPNTPLIIRIKTDNLGISDNNSFTIPVHNHTVYTYNYWVDWGDSTYNWYDKTMTANHIYETAGEKIIKIYGKFPKFYFNNSGDKFKLLEVVKWGNTLLDVNQSYAFDGCSNLESICNDVQYFNLMTNGSYTFRNCPLLTLPETLTLQSLINGIGMFINCKLTTLPVNMNLLALTSGNAMFANNLLMRLPLGMTLSNLTNGSNMFANNKLTDIDNLLLTNLNVGGSGGGGIPNAGGMFSNNLIATIPQTITLNNMTIQCGGGDGDAGIFWGNPISDLGGLILNKLGSGGSNGGRKMFSNTKNVSPSQYSQLLINLDSNNINTGKLLYMGNSTNSAKYDSSGISARANLIAKGWTITDGGLI